MKQRVLRLIILAVVYLHLSSCFTGIYYGLHSIPRHHEHIKGTGELSVSYGQVSGTQVINALGNSGDVYYTQLSNTGNIFASYHYFLSDKIGLGFTAGNQTYRYFWTNDNSGSTYKENVSLTTFGPELKHIFTSSPHFQFYQLIGVAATFRKDVYSDIMGYNNVNSASGLTWNLQWSPIGLSFAGDFGGFVELGIGYKGLVNGGLYFKLPGIKPGRRKK